MLTEFGKICRKIRIDNGELLSDMADRLGVTSAYLSAVELGKRNIPIDWPHKISNAYLLGTVITDELIKTTYRGHIKVYPRSLDEEKAIFERAKEDGYTASSWIRGLIIKELRKRRGKKSECTKM